MTKLTSRQWATIKRNAHNAQPVLGKIATIDKKMAAMAEERRALLAEIEDYENITKRMTGGHCLSDVVRRVVTPTGKTNADGYALTKTDYVPTELVHQLEDGTYEVMDVVLPEGIPAEVTPSVEAVPEVESTPSQAPFNPIAEHE